MGSEMCIRDRIGMGNISGVALAIAIGGPGAIFWMWVTAVFGIATKFFTCTLSVLYRHTDETGEVHGGPMYVIKNGLPKKFHFLAYWFAIAGMIGCLPMFGTNQVIQITRDTIFIGNGWLDPGANHLTFNLAAGLIIAFLTGLIVLGGIQGIGRMAAKTVPAMTALYILITLFALVTETLQALTTGFARLAWGPWLLVLLLGGGGFFLLYSRFLPFRYLPHAFDILRGRYDDPNAKGQISHFQALSTALSGTIGMGNISGVALAIAIGGPGAIFWMWVTAVFGIATKFFTCTLSVLYRHTDETGEVHGGPMYVIKNCLLYTSPSPRDGLLSRMPSSA